MIDDECGAVGGMRIFIYFLLLLFTAIGFSPGGSSQGGTEVL
jgi:hypothetical protein